MFSKKYSISPSRFALMSLLCLAVVLCYKLRLLDWVIVVVAVGLLSIEGIIGAWIKLLKFIWKRETRTRSALMLLLCFGVGVCFDLDSSVTIMVFPVVAEICLEVCLGTGNE